VRTQRCESVRGHSAAGGWGACGMYGWVITHWRNLCWWLFFVTWWEQKSVTKTRGDWKFFCTLWLLAYFCHHLLPSASQEPSPEPTGLCGSESDRGALQLCATFVKAEHSVCWSCLKTVCVSVRPIKIEVKCASVTSFKGGAEESWHILVTVWKRKRIQRSYCVDRQMEHVLSSLSGRKVCRQLVVCSI